MKFFFKKDHPLEPVSSDRNEEKITGKSLRSGTGKEMIFFLLKQTLIIFFFLNHPAYWLKEKEGEKPPRTKKKKKNEVKVFITSKIFTLFASLVIRFWIFFPSGFFSLKFFQLFFYILIG